MKTEKLKVNPIKGQQVVDLVKDLPAKYNLSLITMIEEDKQLP